MGIALGQALGVDFGIDLGIDLSPRTAFAGTPATILAVGERKAWFRADQGITLNGSRVSGWSNVWSNGDLAQVTASAQPLYSATGLNGKAVVINDDGARVMAATLTSAIALGNRMYLWCYCRLDTLPTAFKYFAVLGRSSAPRVTASIYNNNNWRILNEDGNGHTVSVSSGIACTLERHLIEAGLTTGGTGQLVVSGTPVNNTTMSVIAGSAGTTVYLYSASGSAAGPIGAVAEIVAMVGEPTAQQKADMRSYFQTYYGTL